MGGKRLHFDIDRILARHPPGGVDKMILHQPNGAFPAKRAVDGGESGSMPPVTNRFERAILLPIQAALY